LRILWVEDEPHLLSEGAAFLEREGFHVEKAASAAEAFNILGMKPVDLVLLDWMLPDRSGLDVCRQIQSSLRIPVIMITAKTDEFDKVLALEIGADDYIVKPFGMREVVARIRAVARRTGPWSESGPSVMVRGDLRIDEMKHTVHKRGRPIPLTPTEFSLLCTLARNPGRVYTRAQLMDDALGEHFIGFERTIDSHIRNLRKKLGDTPDNPNYIVTVFGVGYKFGDAVHE
jgi:DNA-binding response OmpR family regulator